MTQVGQHLTRHGIVQCDLVPTQGRLVSSNRLFAPSLNKALKGIPLRFVRQIHYGKPATCAPAHASSVPNSENSTEPCLRDDYTYALKSLLSEGSACGTCWCSSLSFPVRSCANRNTTSPRSSPHGLWLPLVMRRNVEQFAQRALYLLWRLLNLARTRRHDRHVPLDDGLAELRLKAHKSCSTGDFGGGREANSSA